MPEMLEKLLEKVENKTSVICIIGLGRVGLPLATVLANSGFKIIGIDNNEERLESIRNSKCPFYDPMLQIDLEKAVKTGNLSVKSKISKAENKLDVIFLTVGTPSSAENMVDYSQLHSALDEIVRIDLKEKIIILRSTLPPRTTEDIIIPALESKTTLDCGKEFALAVCPERILEGKAIIELSELPEIIGGVNEISNKIASRIFLTINPKKDILYTTPGGAELSKLFTNIFRYIGFALANEFAIWAEIYGVDATEIIKNANYNYERSNIPIPGFVGGPCLSKDGTFLDNNTTFSSIVSAAWKLNESIPQHIVNNLKQKLGNLYNKKITVLGASYKNGSDDLRNSPSLKLINLLKTSGAIVKIHDPFVKTTLSLDEALSNNPEIVIIATNHKEFKNIQNQIIKSEVVIIYDVWSMFEPKDFPEIDYCRFGNGKKKII